MSSPACSKPACSTLMTREGGTVLDMKHKEPLGDAIIHDTCGGGTGCRRDGSGWWAVGNRFTLRNAVGPQSSKPKTESTQRETRGSFQETPLQLTGGHSINKGGVGQRDKRHYEADARSANFETSWPKYDDVYKKMHALAEFIDLPCFPDITEGSFLHPNILCMKYMLEINLPDDMNKWTGRVIKKIGVGETDFLTLHPGNKSTWKVKYDILAVAIIIVVLKILFLLDDEYEWLLANYAEEKNKKNEEGCPIFDIRKWYMVVKNILDVEQKKYNEERIRRLWRCEKPLLYSASEKYVVLKKKQMVMDLQRQFRTLTGCLELTEKRKPSLFQFNWTGESTKKDCFHDHSLGAFLQQKGDIFTPLNRDYWLCSVKKHKRTRSPHGRYNESDFPHTYRFVLDLFSFLLRVQPYLIHEEVSTIEHKLFHSKLHMKSRIFKVQKK